MNVLHIGKFFTPFKGGLENYMLDLVTALHRRGVHCCAVVHRHERSFRSVDDVLDAGGHPLHVVRAGTWFKFMYTPFSPMFPVLLRRLVGRYQPDIIHIHMPNPSAFWALLMIGTREIPWVVHWHADVVASTHDPRLRWFYHLYRPLEQWLLRRARAIVATSRAYLEHSSPLAPHLARCHVLPLGLDASRYAHISASPSPPTEGNSQLRVLAIGRLTYYKGFEHLVSATAQARDVQVDIVGTGSRERALRSLVETLGLQERVSLRGELSDEKMWRLIDQCDCICLPSVERTEAFGMVILEAMLHSRATIISDVPGSGMGAIVEHGSTGIKVAPGDEEALASAMAWMRDHPDETRAMGRRGRQKFEEQFSMNQSVPAMIDLYQGLLREHPGHADGV